MARRLKRGWVARLTVAAAVLALPLFAASVASASIAGANPGTTVGRPDLRSATLTSSTSAEFCFDKTLTSGGIPIGGAGFYVQGYRVDNRFEANSAAIDPTNGQCVIVGFSSNVGDINQYTIGTVVGGTVSDNLTGLFNNSDAVALTGSSSTNGTTGHTTGPDLTGILTPSGTDQVNNNLEFTFDQSLAAAPSGTDFYFMDSGGNICWGDGSTPVTLNSTNTVATVHFPKPGGSPNGCTGGPGDGFVGSNGPNAVSSIVSAVRGGIADDAMTAANDTAAGQSSYVSFNPNGSAILPSAPNNGATTRASLVSAQLGSTGDTVTYTFSTNVVILSNSCGSQPTQDSVSCCPFAVWMSNGQFLCANSSEATLASPNQVSVSFGSNLSSQDEYAVKAAIFPGAVEPAANPVTKYENTFESVNLGDNAGALGRGFTTGADVFGVVFNAANGTVTVDLDQRIFSTDNSDICILNNHGDQVANPNPVSADIPTQAAGPEAVVLHFVGGSSGPVAQGTMIAFSDQLCDSHPFGDGTKSDATRATANNSFQNDTNGSWPFHGEWMASQIVAPVGSGARLHAYHRAHRSHHSRRNHKR
jgi:hypothetical protein